MPNWNFILTYTNVKGGKATGIPSTAKARLKYMGKRPKESWSPWKPSRHQDCLSELLVF